MSSALRIPMNTAALRSEKYYVATMLCSQCSFTYPVPESAEASLQGVFFEGLLTMEVEATSITPELGTCPCCKAPTVLRITAVPKNG